jgi:hypothetical protein
MSADLIKIPFADQGDKTATPDTDPNGFVNNTEGYTKYYEISLSSGDPQAKAVERGVQNYLFNLLTSNVQVWQQFGFSPWFSNMPNGYAQNAFVMRQGADGVWRPYRSLVQNNVSDPTGNPDKWSYVQQVSDIIPYVPMPSGAGTPSAEVIGAPVDLNTLTANATYEIQNDAVAAGCANLGTVVSGMLEVKTWKDGSNTNVIQRYSARTGRIMVRGATNGAWSNWIVAANLAGDTFSGNISISTAAANGAFNKYLTNGSMRWQVGRGSDAETGANAGSSYAISRYADNGSYIDDVVVVGRADGVFNFKYQPKWAGKTPWDSGNFDPSKYLPLTGGTLTGNLGISPLNGAATLVVNGILNQPKYVLFSTNNNARWVIASSADGESGSNNGSNFRIERYADDGSIINVPMIINRRLGTISFDGILSVTNGALGNNSQVNVSSGAGTLRGMFALTNNIQRWFMGGAGDGETGGNAGSSFVLARYSDNGTYLNNALLISRATGIATFEQRPQVSGVGAVAINGATAARGGVVEFGAINISAGGDQTYDIPTPYFMCGMRNQGNTTIVWLRGAVVIQS